MGLGIGGEKVVDEGNQAGVFIISFYFTIYISVAVFPETRSIEILAT